MQRAPGEGDPYSVVVQERPGFGSNAVPDPLLSGQRPTGFYLGGGLALAAAAGIAYAGRQVGGLPAVGCYVVAGLSGLYGGYVVLLGGGWQVLSKVLTRASTRAMCRKASERGQRVLELRSRGDFSDSSVGRVMDQINAGLDGTGSCDAVESTGDLYRVLHPRQRPHSHGGDPQNGHLPAPTLSQLPLDPRACRTTHRHTPRPVGLPVAALAGKSRLDHPLARYHFRNCRRQGSSMVPMS